MTIFADASALVAMIAGEPDAEGLADILGTDRERLCSALSIWETMAALCRSYHVTVPDARARAGGFVETFAFRFVMIGEREHEIAADAYARFGKGRHSAALNMGDCFSYACAKAHGARLLYKGQDFAQTDLA